MSDAAEFDKLASDLFKTLGVTNERISSAARSGSWKRREERTTRSMKVLKQDRAAESSRSTNPKRISGGDLASPPSVSSPPIELPSGLDTRLDTRLDAHITKFKPIGACESCGKKIGPMDEACTASEKVYHVACFTCSECNCVLIGKTFYHVKDRVLCQKDYEATLQVCHLCNKQVKEEVLKAVGKVFHPGCFLCSVCHRCLAGVPFTVDVSGQVYCIDDFHLRYAPRCGICTLPIIPAKGTSETTRIVAMDKSFHPKCYKCEDCGVSLAKKDETGHRCFPLDDHLLCRACNAGRIRTITKANSIDFDFALRPRATTT